jgi:spermidine synthase
LNLSNPVRLAAVLVSGLALAGFEAAWNRVVPPVVGSPALAGLVVPLAAAIGLLCGSIYAARRAQRIGDPSRAVPLAQAFAGGTALAAFFVLSGMEGAYAALSGGFGGPVLSSVVGMVLVTAVLFVPCFLLGASLGLGCRPAASFFGVLLIGLGAGLVLTGFVLMPGLGANGCMACMAAAMVVAGCVTLVVRRGGRIGAGLEPAPQPVGSQAGFYLYAAFVVSGLTSAVVWIRVLQQAAGPWPYVIAAAAAVYCASAGLGALLAGRLRHAPSAGRRWLGLAVCAASLTWLVPPLLVNDLPFLYLRMLDAGASGWPGLAGAYFALGLSLLFIPGMLMGVTLPLASANLASSPGSPGTRCRSSLLAVILGWLATLIVALMLPSRQVSLRAMAVSAPMLGVAVGCWFLVSGRSRNRDLVVPAAIAGLALAAAYLSPAWNKGIMTSGVHMFPGRIEQRAALKATLESTDAIFYEESRDRVISVLRTPDGLFLRDGGSTIASTGDDFPSELLAAHIPLAVSSDPRNVLLLGLGAGITAGSIETHQVSRIDCVEPLRATLAAAKHFASYHRNALLDARLNLMVRDPANYLLLSRQAYDLIISRQAPDSREIVRLARARLSPSGILCWAVDLNNLPEEGLESLAVEFAYYFPHVDLWWAGCNQVLLAGSMAPIQVDNQVLRDRLASAGVKQDLKRLGALNDVGLLGYYLMGRERLLAWADNVPRDTRARSFMLYQVPKRMPGRDPARTLISLDALRQSPIAVLAGVDEESMEYRIIDAQLERCVTARGKYFLSLRAAKEGRFGEAAAYIEDARSNCPENGIFSVKGSDFYTSLSQTLARDNKSVEAINAARRALEINPENYRAFYYLAMLERKRDPETAAALLYRATEINPGYLPAYLFQAEAEMAAGSMDLAGETISRVLSLEPFNIKAHHLRGVYLADKGEMADARADLEFVVEAEPKNTSALAALAYTWIMENDLRKAEGLYRRILRIEPDNLGALNNLATVLAERQQYLRAITMWEKALRLDPANKDIRDNIEEARQKMRGP